MRLEQIVALYNKLEPYLCRSWVWSCATPVWVWRKLKKDITCVLFQPLQLCYNSDKKKLQSVLHVSLTHWILPLLTWFSYSGKNLTSYTQSRASVFTTEHEIRKSDYSSSPCPHTEHCCCGCKVMREQERHSMFSSDMTHQNNQISWWKKMEFCFKASKCSKLLSPCF